METLRLIIYHFEQATKIGLRYIRSDPEGNGVIGCHPLCMDGHLHTMVISDRPLCATGTRNVFTAKDD